MSLIKIKDETSMPSQNGELCMLLTYLNDRTISSILSGTMMPVDIDDTSTHLDWTMEWTMVDPDNDKTYKEIQFYANSLYWLKTWQRDLDRNLPTGTCRDERCELFEMIYGFPRFPCEDELFDQTYLPPIQYFYKTLYTAVALSPETTRLNRRVILTRFRAVLVKMSEYKQRFTEDLPVDKRHNNEILDAKVRTSFEHWSGCFRLPFSLIDEMFASEMGEYVFLHSYIGFVFISLFIDS